MPQLTAQKLDEVWSDFMHHPQHFDLHGLTKLELKAAFQAVDGWVDSNAAPFNQAIPQPARGALTAKQKAAILMVVVAKRFDEEPG